MTKHHRFERMIMPNVHKVHQFGLLPVTKKNRMKMSHVINAKQVQV